MSHRYLFFVDISPPNTLIPIKSSTRVSVVHQSCVSFHKSNRQLLEKMFCGSGLIFSSVSSKQAPKLFHL